MSDPLQLFSEWLVYDALGFAVGSKVGTTLDFFIYDSIKIVLLLFVIIFVMAVIRSYISQKRIKKVLSGRVPLVPNFFASLFGAATPFCSCSSIPIFISFLEAGVPLGTAFSFLVTSPLVNEYVAVLMLGFFGWEVAVAYVIAGVILGMIAGLFIGRMGMEKYLVKDIAMHKKNPKKEAKFNSYKERLAFAYSEAKDIVSKLWLWIMFGVGIGAVIHGFIPEEVVESIISNGGIFAVPLAVLVGIPIYANCSAVVPIAVVLFQKGVPLGTALAFMMATAALSLPEAIILRRVMRLKLVALFFGLVAAGIILIGYTFNIFF
ncbi:permease [Candidatus Micrarchaeota archaeon]|nr:permease [Candidatus Micrarchaeota archaeon]